MTEINLKVVNGNVSVKISGMGGDILKAYTALTKSVMRSICSSSHAPVREASLIVRAAFEVGADEFREMMNESVKVDSVDVAELKKQMEAENE